MPGDPSDVPSELTDGRFENRFENRFEDRFGDALRRVGGAFDTDRGARAAVVGGVAGIALVGVGGTGVVMWTAGTVRTDGLRVVVSAFNSGRQDTAATRETPALTIGQLKAIATSGKWLKLG